MSKRNSKEEQRTAPPAGQTTDVTAPESETTAFGDEEGLEEEEVEPPPPSFPPYPPYVTKPLPLCVADVVDRGNQMRRELKSLAKQRVRPYPRPAKPRAGFAGNVQMTRQQLLAHLKCLKRHGVVLTDRLTEIAKPSRRTVLSKWRENAHILPPETILRYRTMLDADDPWSPDQAYQFFRNLRKSKCKTPCQKKKLSKRELQAICGDKRFAWMRKATVAFARGIQKRLCKPGCFTLTGGMLRLSDIILDELCGYMSVRVPARCSNNGKARFMMEMSDKIAIWIDDILAESDDRMLMMDVDEDDVMNMSAFVTSASSGGGDFADNFLNMMGDSFGENPAFMQFSGDMSEAFKILNMAMSKKGTETLLTHGKFTQTYKEGADTLRKARDFQATDFDCSLAQMLAGDLVSCAANDTPTKIQPAMKEMADICAKYLAQNAAYQKDKGEAFQLLLEAMYGRGPAMLYSHGKSQRTYAQAADDLVGATCLGTDSDDPVLSEQIRNELNAMAWPKTPDYLAEEMQETLNLCSRYLSKKAIDEDERGPAFDHLIKSLERHGNMPFTPEPPTLAFRFAAAYVLKSAPSLKPTVPVSGVALTPTSAHSIGGKSPPRTENIIVQFSTLQTSFITFPYQTTQNLLPTGMTKSTTGSLKTMLSPPGDGGGSLKTLNNPPGIGSMKPMPESVEIFNEALHHAVDAETPANMANDMNETVDRCSQYLAAYVRDRGLTISLLLQMMYGKNAVVLVERNRKQMTYGDGASEIEISKCLIPLLPVKDVALEIKNKLTDDMKYITPYDLKISMQTAINDASGYLSQLVAVKSGVAGERYNIELLAAVKDTLGSRPLFKYKAYGNTYREGAKTLKLAGPMERNDGASDLEAEIKEELAMGLPTRIAPTVLRDLTDTINTAVKHLAHTGKQKGLAMKHLVQSMKEKGSGDFIYIQGIPETYEGGARAIEQSPTLHNDSVDRPTYNIARQKLAQLTKANPKPELDHIMPAIVEEASRFLAKQFPQTHADRRDMLARFMARKGNKILGQDGLYKMTFKIGSQEFPRRLSSSK